MSTGEFALLDAVEVAPVADIASAVCQAQPPRERSGSSHFQMPPFQRLVPQADELNRDFMCQLEAVEEWWESTIDLGLRRLAENAAARGANTVLDVRLSEPIYDHLGLAGRPFLEIHTSGTAAIIGTHRPKLPELGQLSVTEWQTLGRAGWQLAGLVSATAVMFVAQSATIGLGRRLHTMASRDLEIYSDVIRAATLLVRGRLEQRVRKVNGNGAVGVTWQQSLHEAEFEVGYPKDGWPTGQEIWRTRMPEHPSRLAAGLGHVRIHEGDEFVRSGTIVAVTATGTAIRQRRGPKRRPVGSELGSARPVLEIGSAANTRKAHRTT